MRFADVHLPTVVRVLDRLPSQFRTKHLSQDDEMLAAHVIHRDERSYNAVVGKVLSKERDSLRLILVDDSDHRSGALWEKRG